MVVLLIGLLAVVGIAGLVLRGGDPYEVTARFASVSGASSGSVVKVAGRRVGTVKSVRLTEDGQAELKLRISDDSVTPLRRGTIAALRSPSLSSVAGKYVDLRIPGGLTEDIPSGGVLQQRETSSSVDLDQVFSTFDEDTRKGLRHVVRGLAKVTDGRSEQASKGWEYLNPSLVASQRLFDEIGGDQRILRRFLVDSAKLSTDLAARRDDVAEVVSGLADTTQAIASRDDELTDAIGQLPPFLRRANTTFANLRATVDDLDGLLADTQPVTPKLRRTLAQLRPFATEARPTLRDLAALTQRTGAHNDLVEVLESFPALRDIAVRSAERNGKERPGSFETSAKALANAKEPLAFLRPYAVELTGWFDDFGHSGMYDANGNFSRVSTVVSPFATVGGALLPVPEELRQQLLNATIQRGQNNRCPGSMERPAPDGSNPWKPTPDFNCDLRQMPPGK